MHFTGGQPDTVDSNYMIWKSLLISMTGPQAKQCSLSERLDSELLPWCRSQNQIRKTSLSISWLMMSQSSPKDQTLYLSIVLNQELQRTGWERYWRVVLRRIITWFEYGVRWLRFILLLYAVGASLKLIHLPLLPSRRRNLSAGCILWVVRRAWLDGIYESGMLEGLAQLPNIPHQLTLGFEKPFIYLGLARIHVCLRHVSNWQSLPWQRKWRSPVPGETTDASCVHYFVVWKQRERAGYSYRLVWGMPALQMKAFSQLFHKTLNS